ncbi:response regulator transcription factor [Desulfococcaceae bacterium HSG9]|nr:response regulator transcription factor [Desulfococcaceae bacterium HSG9]
MRIMIADDHEIVREGLKQLINGQKDMEVVGEAQDGLETLAKVRKFRPDVLLLDITMPRLNGLEAICLIKESMPDLPIVIFSIHRKEAFVHRALAAGVLGYILKASPSVEVLDALRAARRGKYYLSSEINAEVINIYLSRENSAPTGGYDLLTEREQQVFRLMVEGDSTKQIAELLCISPKTVEKHRANLMKKLGVNDLVGLIKYAIKINIIDPDHWD